MVVFVIISAPPLGKGYCALTHPFLTMYLTLVLFHVFQHLWLLTWRILGFFCPEIFDLDPDKSRGRFDFIGYPGGVLCMQYHSTLQYPFFFGLRQVNG